MNPSLRHIPFRRLGTSEVHLRYLEDDPDLQQVLGVRPRSLDGLLKHAPLNARRLLDAKALGGALAEYAARFGAPDAAQENARAIASGEAFVIVTGQQPGLFGGPLYTVHKVATAVRLARDLSAQPGAPKVVPLFWNHSDDHDLDEVNRAFLVNPNQDLQRIRLDLEHGGEPIRDVAVGRALEHALAAASDLLPRSEFRDWAFSLFRPSHADESLAAGTARMLFGMFGEDGLLMIEPRDLPPPAFDVLPRWHAQSDEIRSRVRGIAEHLADVGVDVTLDPAFTMMFQCVPGRRREPLADGDACDDPRQLSPGALMRPLWQDAILPSIGFVVGPGELAYLSVAGPVYKTLGVPKPAFVPRASLTLVEPSLAKLLDRFGWDVPDLARGPDELARVLDDEAVAGPEQDLEQLTDQVRTQFQGIAEQLRETDKAMLGPIERSRGKLLDELDKLAQKVRNSRQNRQGTGLRQIRRLCSNLRPRGRMQERVLNALPFLVAHGQELAGHLVDAADPFSVHHGVLNL